MNPTAVGSAKKARQIAALLRKWLDEGRDAQYLTEKRIELTANPELLEAYAAEEKGVIWTAESHEVVAAYEELMAEKRKKTTEKMEKTKAKARAKSTASFSSGQARKGKLAPEGKEKLAIKDQPKQPEQQ